MSERPDLALTELERVAFLGDVLAAPAPVAFAVHGTDGYPSAGLVDATFEDGAIVLHGGAPAHGEAACLIIERGATYDDITAVVARGVIEGRAMPLDDLVSFAFAKLAPSPANGDQGARPL